MVKVGIGEGGRVGSGVLVKVGKGVDVLVGLGVEVHVLVEIGASVVLMDVFVGDGAMVRVIVGCCPPGDWVVGIGVWD